jgi:hypothetical protein
MMKVTDQVTSAVGAMPPLPWMQMTAAAMTAASAA